ncbi:MAG: ABC transporter substrate-binding protein [Rhodocyclaceae bacterium]
MKRKWNWTGGAKPLGRSIAIMAMLMAGAAQAYNEAPELAAAVKLGKLPPVAQRLPNKPEVIKPLHSIGSYGGALRSALRGSGDGNAILRFVSPQGLVRWNKSFSGLEGNLAESWTVSSDASEFTFKLRPGIKWSDGKPFTTEDILFSMNDLVGNQQFFPSAPSRYVADGKFVKVDRLDDRTVRFKFARSFRTFTEELATPLGQHPVLYPKHYCQQFHPKYNPRVEDEVRALRVQDWMSLMRLKCGDLEVVTRWGNPEKPTLDPWVIEQPYHGGATRVTMRRNPYFWQVDTAGNQLPYIDRLEFKVVSDIETIILAAVSGQLDLQIRHIQNTQNLPLLSENETKGRYKMLALPDINSTAAGIFINQFDEEREVAPVLPQQGIPRCAVTGHVSPGDQRPGVPRAG